ncbi:MAG: hypothetical protein HN368_10870 [Spirochaetales bacterium]|jgi:hypothetical protein|nr:hypothetical protein [Spirochaetales bacterium]
MFGRVILLIAAGIGIYWFYSKRKAAQPKEIADHITWHPIFKDELPSLKSAVPVGYYINLLALSKSRISKEECIERLDELIAKLKDEGLDSQAVATLILKIEQDMNIH